MYDAISRFCQRRGGKWAISGVLEKERHPDTGLRREDSAGLPTWNDARRAAYTAAHAEDDCGRYRAKPQQAAENQLLIEAVFAELDERQPERFTYKVFRLENGVSLVHVVIEHDIDESESLQALPAFQAFVADIAERCDIPPVAVSATIVGGYR